MPIRRLPVRPALNQLKHPAKDLLRGIHAGDFWMNYRKGGPFIAPFNELLLERGADPNVRASIWKRLGPGHDKTTKRHDYRNVTALSWGRRFHDPIFVSEPALRAPRRGPMPRDGRSRRLSSVQIDVNR